MCHCCIYTCTAINMGRSSLQAMDFFKVELSNCNLCEFFLDILANEEECKKTGIIKCVCDRSKRWCSPDPNTCQKWLGNKTDIKKNHELSQNCKSWLQEKLHYVYFYLKRKCLQNINERGKKKLIEIMWFNVNSEFLGPRSIWKFYLRIYIKIVEHLLKDFNWLLTMQAS